MIDTVRNILRPLVALAIIACLVIPGCDAIRQAAPTIVDVAKTACELFATERPVEARQVLDRVQPNYATAAARADNAEAFSPAVLCAIPAFLDVFLADQRAQVARLSRPTTASSGGECLAPPGIGPGAGAETP